MQFASSPCCRLSATIAVRPLASAPSAHAAAPAPDAQSATGALTSEKEELDALLAPIAPYTNALLGRITAIDPGEGWVRVQ